MKCCSHCEGADDLFNAAQAASDLNAYHKNGPASSTRRLLDAITAADVQGLILLDIGGGVGAIQHELIKAGVEKVISVDASAAYLETSRKEAERRAYAGRASYYHGDFVQLAEEISPADIVTLDRVVCCYPDMPSLVRLSAARAKRVYALVFPCERWWIKAGIAVINFVQHLRRHPYRFFVHPTADIDSIARENGLSLDFHHRGIIWQVMVYRRKGASAQNAPL
jgi:2-polyprenyl-3-methyl-5-hydroxy-6-metoxy-1,4-benzoquinol methylase